MNFGNEAMIRKERGEQLRMDDLPPKVTPESNPALEDIDSLLEDITDDLKEGMGYSEVPQKEPDSLPDLDSITLDDLDEDKLNDSLADVSLDEALPNLDNLGNIDKNQWDDILDGSIEDLENMNLDEEPSDGSPSADDFNIDDIDLDSPLPLNDDEIMSIPEEIPQDISDDLSNDLFNDDNISETDSDNLDPDNTDSNDIGLDEFNLEDLNLDNDSDNNEINLADNDGTEETDALLNDININNDDNTPADNNNTDEMASLLSGLDNDTQNKAGSEDNLDDLLTGLDNIDNSSAIPADTSDDMPITDMPFDDITNDMSNNITSDDAESNSFDTINDDIQGSSDDPFNILGDEFSGGSSSDDSDDPFSINNLSSGSDDEFGSFGADNDNTDFNSDDSDSLLNGLNLDSGDGDMGLSLDSDSGDGDMGLSLDDFNDNMDFGQSDSSADEDDIVDSDSDYTTNEEISFGGSDETSEAQPEQPLDETTNVVLSQDGNIKLTDAQRKQIVMSLSVMPKEAELKIAQQIVSGKFSDEQLKPLIDALVNKEKVVNVLRIYEKITGDTSLARVRSKKMSGHDFNEQKKSLSYQFKKNILPIISRLALIMIVLLSLILLYVKIIDPTFRASHYYKVGKQNITENKFDNVEPYFEEAYKLQPRYGQVLDYARLYRTAKRYKAAEVKYDNAYHLKPSKPLAMEMADFYREMKDYGTAVRRYEDLKAIDDTDEDVLIGLGRTHLDWASADRKHLETAKNIFQDVIDMNDKNKDAVFYMMDIAIREGNDRNVMKYYNYIDKNFENKKVEDKYIDAYLDLADFMLKTKRYDEMQDILDKTSKNSKTKMMPGQEYTLSKLKKALNVNDEERVHLNNVLKLFNYIKTAAPLEYNTKESLSLLSDTYNALGENADKFSRGSIEAEQNYIKATQINPLNGKAFYNLGNYELNYKATKNALESAKNNHKNAEKLGFSNDRLNFNLGWIAYKQQDYKESFRRLKPLANKSEDNSNLKLFLGTVYYKMGNYDYAEAYLKENFDHFINLKQIHYPLDMELNDDRQIAEMLVNCANNLGAVYHKKYQRSKKTHNRDMATKCYEDSMEYYDKLKESKDMFLYEVQGAKTADARESKLRQLQVTYAHQNLRNILYPAGNSYEPIIFEEFPLQYESSM
ncbi:MAG: hypothetical protein J6Y01_00905 [Spirochaetales bacterium]|nr:hypothetical protein [Spirochaetales bacterium]